MGLKRRQFAFVVALFAVSIPLLAGCLSGNPVDGGENPMDAEEEKYGERKTLLSAQLEDQDEVPENSSPINLSRTAEDRPPIVDEVIRKAASQGTATEAITLENVSAVEDFLHQYERDQSVLGYLFEYKNETIVVRLLREE